MKTLSKNHIVSMIIGAIVIAVVFFFIGTKVGSHRKASPFNGRGGTGTMAGCGGFGQGSYSATGMRGAAGNVAAGTILSKDDTSITLKLQNGGSRTVLISPSTSVTKSTAGTAADLSVGQDVMVTGTPAADGSISATTVSVRPARPAGSQQAPDAAPVQ